MFKIDKHLHGRGWNLWRHISYTHADPSWSCNKVNVSVNNSYVKDVHLFLYCAQCRPNRLKAKASLCTKNVVGNLELQVRPTTLHGWATMFDNGVGLWYCQLSKAPSVGVLLGCCWIVPHPHLPLLYGHWNYKNYMNIESHAKYSLSLSHSLLTYLLSHHHYVRLSLSIIVIKSHFSRSLPTTAVILHGNNYLLYFTLVLYLLSQ